jgi:hypothetical protein
VCEDCAWRRPGSRRDRCLRHAGRSVKADWPACPAHQRLDALDCLTCGACCREAYHAVEVGPRDPFVKRHPALVVPADGRLHVLRDGPRCACLGADRRCAVYADRPRTCRDFERGGPNCVEARRRVGLSA